MLLFLLHALLPIVSFACILVHGWPVDVQRRGRKEYEYIFSILIKFFNENENDKRDNMKRFTILFYCIKTMLCLVRCFGVTGKKKSLYYKEGITVPCLPS